MSKVNVTAAAVALGSTVAGVFLLASILFAALPQSVGWVAHLFHVDVTRLYRPLGPADVLLGAACWWLVAAGVGAVAAAVYNRMTGT